MVDCNRESHDSEDELDVSYHSNAGAKMAHVTLECINKNIQKETGSDITSIYAVSQTIARYRIQFLCSHFQTGC